MNVSLEYTAHASIPSFLLTQLYLFNHGIDHYINARNLTILYTILSAYDIHRILPAEKKSKELYLIRYPCPTDRQ